MCLLKYFEVGILMRGVVSMRSAFRSSITQPDHAQRDSNEQSLTEIGQPRFVRDVEKHHVLLPLRRMPMCAMLGSFMAPLHQQSQQ